jgi:hypothetical protein
VPDVAVHRHDADAAGRVVDFLVQHAGAGQPYPLHGARLVGVVLPAGAVGLRHHAALLLRLPELVFGQREHLGLVPCCIDCCAAARSTQNIMFRLVDEAPFLGGQDLLAVIDGAVVLVAEGHLVRALPAALELAVRHRRDELAERGVAAVLLHAERVQHHAQRAWRAPSQA